MTRSRSSIVSGSPATRDRPGSTDVIANDVRFLPAGDGAIVPATDLGSAQVLKHGNFYLLTDAYGDVQVDPRGLGLYCGDTRALSTLALRIGGRRPVLLQGSVGGDHHGTVVLTNPIEDLGAAGRIHPMELLGGHTLAVTRERVITAGGLREELRFVNHGERDAVFEVALEMGADGADIFEVRGHPRPRRGRRLPVAVTDRRVTFRHEGLDGTQRLTHVAFTEPAEVDAAPDMTAGASVRVSWSVALRPGEALDLGWTVWVSERPSQPEGADRAVEEAELAALFPGRPLIARDDAAADHQAWKRSTASVDSDSELLDMVVDRSVSDLRLLLNDGPTAGERYLAAGVPWFTTLFGRDALIAAFQALPFRARLAEETLTVLAGLQATEDDPSTDAEPGKIPHELRTGEMARAGEVPHTPYYGSVDATPLWLILLGATYDWTGDRAMVDRLWPHALAALDWIDRHGDRDGDGFIEYERRSERGLVNHGWKDASDSIRDRTGREASTPIALAEVQGYVYDAGRRMAHLARVRGESDLAARLEADAEALRERFEASFWVEDLRYYAMALDGDKRPMDAIASNVGHGLWSGIVASDRARDVADHLLGPALFSGWGVRTLAAGQPGYNPIGYHTGTVWPHDTSIIAAGLKRYGFDDASDQLAGGILEAAQRFPDSRLPELFCGFDRGEAEAPVAYPTACSPQAWSAGAPFLLLATMLGLRAHAERRELELRRPRLPTWLRNVTVRDLRVGAASLDLRLHRSGETTSVEVLRKVGDVEVAVRL